MKPPEKEPEAQIGMEEEELPSFRPAPIPPAPKPPSPKNKENRVDAPGVPPLAPVAAPQLQQAARPRQREVVLAPAKSVPLLSDDGIMAESDADPMAGGLSGSRDPDEPLADGDAPENAPHRESAQGGGEDDVESGEDAGDDDREAESTVDSTGPEQDPPMRLEPAEKGWFVLLFALLAFALLVVGYLMRGAFPQDDKSRLMDFPKLPIRGKIVTIDAIDLRWREVKAEGEEGIRRTTTLVPEVRIRPAPGSSGALRVFFRDDAGTQVGDTLNLRIRGGKIEGYPQDAFLNGTGGLPTRLDYDDLRSRENKSWKVEIFEGEDPLASISAFELLANIRIPWNLQEAPKP